MSSYYRERSLDELKIDRYFISYINVSIICYTFTTFFLQAREDIYISLIEKSVLLYSMNKFKCFWITEKGYMSGRFEISQFVFPLKEIFCPKEKASCRPTRVVPTQQTFSSWQ